MYAIRSYYVLLKGRLRSWLRYLIFNLFRDLKWKTVFSVYHTPVVIFHYIIPKHPWISTRVRTNEIITISLPIVFWIFILCGLLRVVITSYSIHYTKLYELSGGVTPPALQAAQTVPGDTPVRSNSITPTGYGMQPGQRSSRP